MRSLQGLPGRSPRSSSALPRHGQRARSEGDQAARRRGCAQAPRHRVLTRMSRSNRPAPGLVALVATLASLAATFLWLSMVAAPWQLAGGLLGAGDHLQQAQKALSKGSL